MNSHYLQTACKHKFVLTLNANKDGNKTLYEANDDNKKDFSIVWKISNHNQNNKVISIFLVNKEKSSIDKAVISTRCIFSPEIFIKSNKRFIIAKRKISSNYLDSDLESLNLLYNNR